jgi:DNA-directed RNA polymerase subunit RPC12/RpoP
MASVSCPDCGVRVQPEDLICFRCGANLPHASGPDDDLLTPTISQKFITGDLMAVCPRCGTPVRDAADVVCHNCGEPLPTGRRRRISPVVMRITFPTGNVDIPAGTSVLLGRDPAESLVAAAFAQFDNVSRRHATVQVDDYGHATIMDENSTNGTFVNDDRVLPGVEVRLVDGDRVRLAADVTGDVSLPQGEPDPSGLSRNGR